jgi:hypothetical protein
MASDLPHLSEDDPMAKAMKYTNDASSVDPSTRNNPAADQNCANCALIQAGEGDWRPCQIFPGKAVNAAGWCSVWAPDRPTNASLNTPASESAFSFVRHSFIQCDLALETNRV